MSVQAYVLHGHSSGNGTRPGVAFFGDAAVAAQCLTGQPASVHGVLARLHIHTGRLDWGDFGFEFWDLHEASASARPCSMGPTLLRRAWSSPGLDAAGRPHSPPERVRPSQIIMAPQEYKISWLVHPVSPKYLSITVNQQQSHPHSSQAVNRSPLRPSIVDQHSNRLLIRAHRPIDQTTINQHSLNNQLPHPTKWVAVEFL